MNYSQLGWHHRGGIDLIVTDDRSYFFAQDEIEQSLNSLLNIDVNDKFDRLRTADFEAKIRFDDRIHNDFDKAAFKSYTRYLSKNGYFKKRNFASPFELNSQSSLDSLIIILACVSNNNREITSSFQKVEANQENLLLHLYKRKKGLTSFFNTGDDRGQHYFTIPMKDVVSFIANYSGVSFMLYSGEVLDFGQGVTDATQYDELFDSLMLAQHKTHF